MRENAAEWQQEANRGAAEAFDAGYGVTVDALEGYVGKRIDAFTEADIVRLGKIFRALEEGVAGSKEVLEKLRNAGQTAKPAAKRGAKPAPAPEQEPAPAPEEPEEDEEELSLDDL